VARIAEDVLLLLLDNESAQPQLDRARLGRLLAAGLLLDLALGCRVRPAVPGDPAASDTLVALSGPVPLDPAVRPALTLLEQAPLTAADAIANMRKHAEDDVLDQLLRSGQIHQIQLSSHRLRRNTYAWPLHNRTRVDSVRAAALAALVQHQTPDLVTAVTIALLQRASALGTALHLDDSGLQQVSGRAQEITFGARPDTTKADEVNLSVTAAVVLPALV
jgi:hypothetical protein